MSPISILFAHSDGSHAYQSDEPSFFKDLNLDQVADALSTGREEYALKPIFYTPLQTVDGVQYRHEVLLDLAREPILACVMAFARSMRHVRDYLTQVGKLHYQHQQNRWFLDAAGLYCDAVVALREGLDAAGVASRGFRALLGYLSSYIETPAFQALASEHTSIREQVDAIRYSLLIRANRVTVGYYEGEPDYGAEVERTFAKFEQGATKDYTVKLSDWPDMNHVEGQVLKLVARLFPDVFQALGQFREHHSEFMDETIRAFDREVQFYLGYLDLTAPLKGAGLPFCYPTVSVDSKEVSARDTFDLALARKLAGHDVVVRNDFELQGHERIYVITGPNQGGKTTFARFFGQLHYLASLGLPVPGAEARLFLPDAIFTHFEREETIETLRGKLEDELVRVHDIFEHATGNSLLVMNESFASTTAQDALYLGTHVLNRIVELGALCVYVTFIDELSTLSETIVSLMSMVVPDNPATRTYKILRQPANGLAYAAAIAEKYGLTYASLRRRVAGRSAAV